MKLCLLTMNCFLSYKEETIKFDSLLGVVFFVGRIANDAAKSNGSGKSAIFDAISWALYGVSRTSSDDEIIMVGQKTASVTLNFEMDAKQYSITRIKKLGKSQTLSFVCVTEGIQLTGNSVKETQAAIINAMGLDSELFENTVFARQGCIDLFPRQSPSKRKEMLRDILKVSQYEQWETNAREMARTYDVQYQTLTSSIQVIENALKFVTVTQQDVDKKQLVLQAVQGKVKQVGDDITTKTQECTQLRAVKQALAKEEDNNTNLGGAVDRAEMQLKYLDKSLQDELDKIMKDKASDMELVAKEGEVNNVLSEISSRMNEAQASSANYQLMAQQGTQLEQDVRRITGMLKEYNEELDKLRKKLNTFDELGDKCPMCYSVINEEQRAKVKDEIVAEGLAKKSYRDNLETEKANAEDTLKKLRAVLAKGMVNPDMLRGYEADKRRYESELINIQTAKNRVEFADTKMSETKSLFIKQKLELNFEIKRKKAEFDKSFQSIEVYKSQLAGLEKMESEMASLSGLLTTYQREERQIAEELHRMEYELKDKVKKEEELAMNKMKADKAQADLFTYTELTKAFGKNGIPLLIVENALSELQSEVTAQLATLTDGAIAVEFRTQKELKSGKMADSLDIIVSDKSGSRDFSLYSGGEKMRVALAIRLGLAKLLSRRAGKKFELLIIDEVSDLDSHGMAKFVELIGLVAKDYKQVFIVSHINELKDSFGQVVTIVKDREGSRVNG